MTALCPFCKKPPGEKVGPPALVRCITPNCEGTKLAAETPTEWDARLGTKLSMQAYEREALDQLLLNSRAIAGVLGTEEGQGRKMAIWAQIVETWLEKVDEAAQH